MKRSHTPLPPVDPLPEVAAPEASDEVLTTPVETDTEPTASSSATAAPAPSDEATSRPQNGALTTAPEALSEPPASPMAETDTESLVALAPAADVALPPASDAVPTVETARPLLMHSDFAQDPPPLNGLDSATAVVEDIAPAELPDARTEDGHAAVSSPDFEARVEAEVSVRLAAALLEQEVRLLADIRARGLRPVEGGLIGGGGIALHPAVDRLTRRDRAALAARAGRGELIEL